MIITTLADVFALPLRRLSIERNGAGEITVKLQRDHASTSYSHTFHSRETFESALIVAGEAEARQMRYEAARAALLTGDPARFGEGIPEPATFVPLDVGDDDLRFTTARPVHDPRD